MAKKKINWLLILQGWAMLWVVIGHSPLKMDESMPLFAKVLYEIAYSFHMPLFILISGYLFYMTRLRYACISRIDRGGWTYKTIMFDKLKRLGIPFVVFTIIAMVMKSLFPGDMARQASFTISEFIHAILYPREGPLLEMWFVAVIMWMFALTPLWNISFRSKMLSFVTFVFIFAMHMGVDYLPIGTFLCLRDTARFCIYFYIGMLACKYGLDDRYKSSKYMILIISIFLYLAFALLNLKFAKALSAIAFSIGLAFLLDEYKPKAFSSFRNYTYQIFLISIFVQISIKMIYKRVAAMEVVRNHSMLTYGIFFLICLLVGLYIPVIVSKIAEKINFRPILLCLGLKKSN